MPVSDITTKKNSRKGFRGYVTQQSKAIDTLIADFEQRQQAAAAAPSTSNAADDDFTKTVDLVLTSLKQIEARWASEDKVNCEIISLIADVDELTAELGEQENHKDEVTIKRIFYKIWLFNRMHKRNVGGTLNCQKKYV